MIFLVNPFIIIYSSSSATIQIKMGFVTNYLSKNGYSLKYNDMLSYYHFSMTYKVMR